MTQIKKFISILLFSFLVSPLYAASFDCSKATTETEIAICNDPELSALDERMSKAYSGARHSEDGTNLNKGNFNG